MANGNHKAALLKAVSPAPNPNFSRAACRATKLAVSPLSVQSYMQAHLTNNSTIVLLASSFSLG